MTGLSLFSGIGGLDLAFEWAGGTVVAMCEIDPFCRMILKKYWPDVPLFGDVREVQGTYVGTVDVIYGGYPCQPFSTMGTRGGKDDSRYLWPHFMRLIREIRPNWVVGENVAGHISLGLDAVLYDLESSAYTARAFCISAGAIGAPHRRQRVFVVAHSNSKRLQRRNNRDLHQERRRKENHAEVLASYPSRFPKLHDIPAPWILRTGDGLPDRTHRIKALGNAVVPQQAYPIFKAIAEVEKEATG